jgi:hypothetical protein
VIFVCAATGLGAAGAAAGCSSSSSSSNPTAPVDAGLGEEANVAVDSGFDGGATSVTLQWKVVSYSSPDGGVADNGSTDAAASDGAAADSAATDSAAADSGASEAGVSEASAGDAEAGAGDAGTVAEGTDAETDAGETDAAQGVDLGTAPPLPGAQVCVYQMSAFPCVTTAADGTFTIPGLPIRADLVLAVTKSGYTSVLQPIETASTDMDGRGNPILLDRPDPTFVPPGVTVDSTKGIISAFAVGDAPGNDSGSFVGIPGTTVALSPMSGSGPFYTSAMGGIDPSATSFESSGAYYFNVAPGTYTLTYTSSTFDCEPISFPFGEFGFPVTTPAHSLKIVVAAGYTTGIVGSFCTPNPVIVKVDGG